MTPICPYRKTVVAPISSLLFNVSSMDPLVFLGFSSP